MSYPSFARCIAFLLISLSVISTSYAFESSEHERISNVALHVAVAYYRAHENIPSRLRAAELLRATPGKYESDKKHVSPENLSYGDIVACVDFFLNPEKLLADAFKWNRRSVAKDGMPMFVDGEPHIDFMRDCHSAYSGQSVQAGHNNQAHFQYDALVSFRLYHLAAIAMAADKSSPTQERDIFAALSLNAIADHYLEDLFAPGHIVTPRDGMSDVPATAMHDRANEDGLHFVPKTAGLIDLLRFICGDQLDQSSQIRCPLAKELHLEQIVRTQDDAYLIPVVRSLISATPNPILFKGDQRLWDPTEAQLAQRLLLLLVTSRSILDILMGEDHIKDVTWRSNVNPLLKGKWGGRPVLISYIPAEAGFTFGQYVLPKFTKNDDPTESVPTDTQRSNAAAMRSISASENRYGFGTFAPIVGVDVHRESMSSGSRAGRNALSIEAVPAGIPIGNLNLGVALGYTRYQEGEINGQGPTLRLIGNFPQTEFNIGPYFRWLSYPSETGRQRKMSYGMRVDAGFSSYLMFFLGVGIDHGTTPTMKLDRGWIWTGGIEFALPLSRITRSSSKEPK